MSEHQRVAIIDDDESIRTSIAAFSIVWASGRCACV
jgi:hypothetical protein